MKNLFKIQLASDKRTYFKKEMKQILDFEEELEKHNKKYFKIELKNKKIKKNKK